MLKLALAAAISMMFVLEPAAAATKHKGHAAASKRVKAKRTNLAKVIADDNRQRMVRRIEMVHGKRHVVYQRVRHAAPVVAMLSAGDIAGLSRTHDPLDLRSNDA